MNNKVRSLGLVAMSWGVGYAPLVAAQETPSQPRQQPSPAEPYTLPDAALSLPTRMAAQKAEATSPPGDPGVTVKPNPFAVAFEEEEEVEETDAQFVVVGSRRPMRSVLDSPTPVDTLEAEEFIHQGTTDMDGLLRTLVPSYNVSPQPVSDAAILVRPANLRGLSPDSTVVLLNGKRRHRGSVIAFLGSGLSDGAQGVDLGPIPSLALKRVEVLRDGAAAQYGSDAIAGVMNFVLRDDATGVRVVSKVGSTYEGDGTAWSIAGNVGLPITDSGFFNLTVEYGNVEPTSRSVQRADAAQLAADGLPVADPAQVWGNPEISDDLKIFANFGQDLGNGVNIYAFGNIARRDILGFFFFRNPTNYGGVYSADGGDTLLVADLTPNDAIACPIVDVSEGGVINPITLAQVANDPNCFVFNELFPGGFQPRFGGRVTDLSLAGGVRGVTSSGLVWDLSAVVGSNQADFRIVNTINASLGPNTPTEFQTGSYREVDQTYNFDLSYALGVGAYSPLTIATGTEFRIETFSVTAGDAASTEAGPLTSQGFSIGSNGFPGFPTDIAGSFNRRNIAGYLDLTIDVIKPWTVQIAGRVENFDTFGTQGTIKTSTRFQVSDLFGGEFNRGIAVRGAIGTGFRAPSAGQANVSNVTTVLRSPEEGNLVQRGTIPPTNPIAQSKGGTELDPETSVNITGGVIIMFDDLLQITADFYNITVKDRISQSATQTLTPEEARDLEASGIRGAIDLAEFRFFTNAFDTSTRGVDVVATSRFALGDIGDTTLSAAYAWNETRVDFVTEGVIDEQRISELEEQLPQHRFIITGNHRVGPFRTLLRGSYYGSWANPTITGDAQFGGRFLLDAEVAYSFFDRFTLVAGAQNLLNTFPEENPEDNQASLGGIYPENSPLGIGGGFWYFRLQAELW